MEVGEPETGPSSPFSLGKDSSRASNEFDSGIETMEVDDAIDKQKATEKRKRTSSRYYNLNTVDVWNPNFSEFEFQTPLYVWKPDANRQNHFQFF